MECYQQGYKNATHCSWIHHYSRGSYSSHYTGNINVCTLPLHIGTVVMNMLYIHTQKITRHWDNRGYSKNLGSPCIRPRSIFSQIFNSLLFAWTLWIYLPNLTFVALPIPEIIGGTSKSWGVPGFAHAPYSPKFLKGFCSHGTCQYTRQVWSS